MIVQPVGMEELCAILDAMSKLAESRGCVARVRQAVGSKVDAFEVVQSEMPAKEPV